MKLTSILRALAVLTVTLVALSAAPMSYADPGDDAPAGPQAGDSADVVQSLSDSGPGSLRAVVGAVGPGDTALVTFAANVRGQITLKSPISVDAGKVLIDGPGAAGLRISGNNAGRVFVVSAGGSLGLSNLTVTQGRASAPPVAGAADGQAAEGGAILNRGTLTLDGVAVTDSTAVGGYSASGRAGPGYGGAIYNYGTLRIDGSRFSGDVARGGDEHDPYFASNKEAGGDAGGGAIRNEGSLEVSSTEFSGNSAVGGDGASVIVYVTRVGAEGGSAAGGAIYDGKHSQRFGVFDSTFAGNGALGGAAGGGEVRQFPGGDAAGGAISSWSGEAAVVQSTLTGNGPTLSNRQGSTASGRLGAGALDLRAGASSLLSDTIVFNGGTADIETSVPVPTQNTIVGSCAGAGLKSRGFNLDYHSSCGMREPTDLQNLDARLGPLSDQGGPTRTMPLTTASPAVDAGRSGEERLDQRGATRPVQYSNRALPPRGNAADIGAFELQVVPQVHWDLSPQSVSFGPVDVGAASHYQEVTLRNDGNLPFHVGTVTIGGDNPDEFSISSQTCAGTDLAAGAGCKVRVRFSPEDAGAQSGRLTIAAQLPTGPLDVPLLGTGVAERRDTAADPQPDPHPRADSEDADADETEAESDDAS